MCNINEIKKHIVHYRVLNTESSINKNSCFFNFSLEFFFFVGFIKERASILNPNLFLSTSLPPVIARSEQSMLGQYNTHTHTRTHTRTHTHTHTHSRTHELEHKLELQEV